MVHSAAIDCTNSFSKKNDVNISFFKLPKEHYNVCFSKITKTWSAKPIKETKSLALYSNLVDQTFGAVLEGKQFKAILTQNFPRNIAPIEKPDKLVVLGNQKSRFNV